MDLINITLENIDQNIEQDEFPFVLDFYAPWSLPCMMFKEKLEFARTVLNELAVFGTVNIDDTPELAERFSVITIPTTLVLWKGKIVHQYIGIQEPELFEEAILKLYEDTGVKVNRNAEEKSSKS